MIFIEVRISRNQYELVNVDHIVSIAANNPHNKDKAILTMLVGDLIHTDHTYKELCDKLNESCEYGLIIKMDEN